MDNLPNLKINGEDIVLVKKIAKSIVKKIGFYGLFEDLVQEGLMGLLQAKKKYKEDEKASFTTYASYRIKGAMQDYLRSQDHLSRDSRQFNGKVASVRTKLEHQNLTEASTSNIAKEMNMTSGELMRGIADSPSKAIVFLEILPETQPESDYSFNSDRLDEAELHALKLQLMNKIMCLDSREKKVVTMRYWDEASYQAISNELGVSTTKCIQLHERSMVKMRKAMSV